MLSAVVSFSIPRLVFREYARWASVCLVESLNAGFANLYFARFIMIAAAATGRDYSCGRCA